MGLALGDGNLSNSNGRAVRLRITCDTKYPTLIANIQSSLQDLLPDNRVSIVGRKHLQGIHVPQWIRSEHQFCIQCLRGLIETDGCIYTDRGYAMVMYSSITPALAEHVFSMIQDLSFRPHIYKIKNISKRDSYKYQIRLSHNVQAFLNLVQPVKK